MRLFLIGCEYAGTTTLAISIYEWAKETLGIDFGIIHDHWKIPDVVEHYPNTLTEEEHQQFLGLSTRIKEAYMRHNLYYHTPHEGHVEEHNLTVGYYIEDTIYAHLYYNYGGTGQAGTRTVHSKKIEEILLNLAPQTVLVLVKAAPEVIARRMKENPHPYQVIKEQDIEHVSRLFETAFEASRIQNKLILDTSQATEEESLAEFAEKIQPFLTEIDQIR